MRKHPLESSEEIAGLIVVGGLIGAAALVALVVAAFIVLAVVGR